MKKILGFIFALLILIYGTVNTASAKEVSSAEIINDMYIQKRISDIGLQNGKLLHMINQFNLPRMMMR